LEAPLIGFDCNADKRSLEDAERNPAYKPNPVILIGQYDSPFVRRVAIALRLYGLPFEHRPWSTFGEGDKIAPYNPLRRVPTLVLDGGEALIESTAILDYLDELAGPEKAVIAARGPERRHALKICALATGLADKGVSLLYERVLRKDQSKIWVERCEAQIGGVLDVLEKERAAIATPYWFGERIGHADIAVACALRFTGEAHPALFGCGRYPALAAHAARCEALPPFQEIVQPLAPPSGD
jgi:glutathione S-transferase